MSHVTVHPKVAELQKLLHIVYTVLPIAAGLDKFTNIMVDWEIYLHPQIEATFPIEGHVIMMIVGVIEVVAGILVFIKPKLGSKIVAAWLVLITCNLVFSGWYFDIAVRDIVMAIGAYVLYELTCLVKD